MCRRRADDTRVRLRWRFQVADDKRRPDVIRTSSAHRSQAGMSSTCCPHMHMSSPHHLPVIHTTPHGQCGPELSFTVTGICVFDGICGRNVELFHFRIM